MAKYDPLHNCLRASGKRTVVLSFDDIERCIGETLPRSAQDHREWWGNHAGNVQGRSWLQAGYVVDHVDRARGIVTFVRA